MKTLLIGTFFKTRKLAEDYIRQKRLRFETGYNIVPIKNGFIVTKNLIMVFNPV